MTSFNHNIIFQGCVTTCTCRWKSSNGSCQTITSLQRSVVARKRFYNSQVGVLCNMHAVAMFCAFYYLRLFNCSRRHFIILLHKYVNIIRCQSWIFALALKTK